MTYAAALDTVATLFQPSFANPAEYPANFIMCSAIMQLLPAIMLLPRPGMSLKQRRLSLVPGYQVDRLALVHLRSRTSKLAKVIT